MSKNEKGVFCKVLKDVKVSDSYASNISRQMNLKEQILYFLKSHVYHILMHDLLPITCDLPWTLAIIELCNIFKALCDKVLNVEKLEKLQDQAAITLC